MVPSILLAVSLAAPPPVPVPVLEPPDPTAQPGDEAVAVEYSRNGKLLAVFHTGFRNRGTEHRIDLYDTATWKVVHTMTGPAKDGRTLAFSADGAILFAGGFDGKVYSW